MFDLEKAIADWRGKMIAAGIKDAALLDELESHLRADFGSQAGASGNPETAFKDSMGRIGDGSKLRKEFAKLRFPANMCFEKLAAIASLVFALTTPGIIE